jgi:hypothetical protein
MLVEGGECGHGNRIIRPHGPWGRKGAYCLRCGWRIWKDSGRLLWGGERLSLVEVQGLRAQMNLTPLNRPDEQSSPREGTATTDDEVVAADKRRLTST